MIDRYTTGEMAVIWSSRRKYENWLLVERAYLHALAEQGVDVGELPEALHELDKINISRVVEADILLIEKTVKHDVVAFIQWLDSKVKSKDIKRFLHFGLTSSDIVDTANALSIKDAMVVISNAVRSLICCLKIKAKESTMITITGRTHGQHAKKMPLFNKFALYVDMLSRVLDGMNFAANNMYFGKASGPVGAYSSYSDIRVEEWMCSKLGLRQANITSQIVPRDVYASYINSIAVVGCVLEKIALDIRILQQTEIGEVEEPFSNTQVGSSSMPHKRNPIISENICGLSRMLRGYTTSMMESVAVWNERDISHSSVERVVLPDATSILHYMLVRMEYLISGLVINANTMAENIDSSVYSNDLVKALVAVGMERTEAIDKVSLWLRDARINGHDFVDHVFRLPVHERVITDKQFSDIVTDFPSCIIASLWELIES